MSLANLFTALMDSIKADHGFNLDSRSIRNLLHIMSELSDQDRRDFLQFVSGSPKLPIGGKLRFQFCPSMIYTNRLQASKLSRPCLPLSASRVSRLTLRTTTCPALWPVSTTSSSQITAMSRWCEPRSALPFEKDRAHSISPRWVSWNDVKYREVRNEELLVGGRVFNECNHDIPLGSLAFGIFGILSLRFLFALNPGGLHQIDHGVHGFLCSMEYCVVD